MNLLNVKDEVNEAVTAIDPIKAEEIYIDRLKWANRRKQAWICIYMNILLIFIIFLAALFEPILFDRLIKATDLLTWLFAYLNIPVILYGGGTVAQSIMASRGGSMGGWGGNVIPTYPPPPPPPPVMPPR